MSEEKLYAVKNDEGKWANAGYTFGPCAWATSDKSELEKYAKYHDCHVVTLIDEPKKVVLSEKQAEIVKNAHGCDYPATSISGDAGENGNSDDEELLMNAYVNGYTVEKKKKYNVKVPHTDDSYFYKVDDKYCNAGDSYYLKGMTDKKRFTDAEIEHYGLGDCEKVWCDSDDE